MIEVLHVMQCLMVLSWGVPIVMFRHNAWTKAADDCDRLKAAMWYTSASIAAFPLKWLILGNPSSGMTDLDLVIWSAIYVFGIISGQFLTWTIRALCNGRT